MKKFCGVDAAGEKLLETAVTRLGMSARAYDRILKVGRMVATWRAMLTSARRTSLRPSSTG